MVSADGVATDPDKTGGEKLAQAKNCERSEIFFGLRLVLLQICPAFCSMSKTTARAGLEAV